MVLLAGGGFVVGSPPILKKIIMKLSIYKFPFTVTDYVKIFMPKGAKILSVQNQNETPCIWAICDVDAEKEEREFEVYGTGNPYFDGSHRYGKENKFIGTFQLYNGSFVGHLFELVEIAATNS